MSNYIDRPHNEKELHEFLDGERIAQPYMDKEYPLLGYTIIDRYGNKKRDLIVSKNGDQYKFEEKFRQKDYGDFLVELIQCMIIYDRGWFYTTKADYISYVICNERWIPQKIYLVDFPEFKDWLFKYLAKKKSVKSRISPKGIGLTFNIAIPWVDIPREICQIYLTECRAPWNRNRQYSLSL